MGWGAGVPDACVPFVGYIWLGVGGKGWQRLGGAPDAWVPACCPPQVPEKRVSEMLHFRVSDDLRSIEEPGIWVAGRE